MASITNPLTRLLGIRTPIVSAPMAMAAGGALASQVSLAGGFGFIGLAFEDRPKLKAQLDIARAALSTPPGQRLTIGVGALGWLMEKPGGTLFDTLTLALEEGVQAVWLSFGNELGKWVRLVREYDAKHGREGAERTLIFTVCSSAETALVAANEWKVDVIVAQGNEAGGHGVAASPPVATLLAQIVSALPSGPPILAAGGMVLGSHIASALSLGASGAVVGTRLLATPEALYSPAQKAALVAAQPGASVRSMAFDRARGTLGWPAGVDGRALRNASVDDEARGAGDEEMQRLSAEDGKKGGGERLLVWAGAGVGDVKQIMPAKDVIVELHEGIRQSLSSDSPLLAQ